MNIECSFRVRKGGRNHRAMPHATAAVAAANTHDQIGMKINAKPAVEELVAVPPQSNNQARWKRAGRNAATDENVIAAAAAGPFKRNPAPNAANAATTRRQFHSVNVLKVPCA